jgi:hypothetical protein
VFRLKLMAARGPCDVFEVDWRRHAAGSVRDQLGDQQSHSVALAIGGRQITETECAPSWIAIDPRGAQAK